jgi:hypothetical protein
MSMPGARLDRRHLLEINVGEAVTAYADAVRNGHRDPVVLILDVRDPAAESAALPLVGRAALDDFRRRMEAQGLIPTLAVGLPYGAARDSLPPELRAALDPPHPGTFRAVVIAAGGSLFARMQIPPP